MRLIHLTIIRITEDVITNHRTNPLVTTMYDRLTCHQCLCHLHHIITEQTTVQVPRNNHKTHLMAIK